MDGRLVIWHTNDMHGRLSRPVAERLRALREGTPGSLLLDAGDALAAGNILWRRREPVLGMMRLAGYTAMCLGNREFHVWRMGFASKLRDCPHPVLATNLRSRSRPLPKVVRASMVTEASGGTRVGLLGLTVPMVTRSMSAARMSHYLFEDPVEAAWEMVEQLRGQCELVIAVTHLGLRRDRELLAQVPGIEIVVGGHSHTPLSDPEMHEGRCIVQSKPYAKAVGRVEVEVRRGRVKVLGGELLAL